MWRLPKSRLPFSCSGSRAGCNSEFPNQIKSGTREGDFRFQHSAFPALPLPLCRLFSERHCRGIGINFFTATKPTEGAATQIPGSIAIGDLVKMSFGITEYTDHRLGQPQRREQPA